MREDELFSAYGASPRPIDKASMVAEQLPPSLFDAERFWRRVKVGGPDECWPWRGERNKAGYGIVRRGSLRNRSTTDRATPQVREYAHRVAYDLEVRALLEGEVVRQQRDCDKACCNPRHLRADTKAGLAMTARVRKPSSRSKWTGEV